MNPQQKNNGAVVATALFLLGASYFRFKLYIPSIAYFQKYVIGLVTILSSFINLKTCSTNNGPTALIELTITIICTLLGALGGYSCTLFNSYILMLEYTYQ